MQDYKFPHMIRLRIAMLGDDRSQLSALRGCLLTAGHTAHRYKTAAEFLNAVNNTDFDALILSCSAPDLTGLELLARVRHELQITVPVIIVTPPKGKDYIISALQGGADEVITTPVGDREFLARLEAVTRRWTTAEPTVRSFQAGRLTVNAQARKIFLNDRPVELTNKDYDLAVLLLSNIGRLVSRSHILHAVWGWKQIVKSRTLDTHMSRVRIRLQLIESHGWRLSAVYRKGYRLERFKDAEQLSSED